LKFGPYVRHLREERLASGGPFSLRSVAKNVGIEPTYLSKIEREELPPPSERVITALAVELGEDPDVLLAMAGRVPADFVDMLRKHPRDFALFIQKLRQTPETIERLAQQVRDGEW
jgi:HTH-type transcriptional regulator, competence development regulator